MASPTRDDNAWAQIAERRRHRRPCITDTLAELLQRDENDLPAAIVLVTDGRDNGSTDPVGRRRREAARLKVPIHVYGIGGSTAGLPAV